MDAPLDKKLMIGLREDMNPEYYELQSEAGALFERWTRINLVLGPFRVARVPFFNSRPHLRRLFEPYAQLVGDTNRWLTWADDFFRKHPPWFEEGQDRTMNFLYLQRSLDRQIDSMQMNKFINRYTVQVYEDAIDKRQNFQIAILSFVIALAGLILAIFL